jgi:hypothetical protein
MGCSSVIWLNLQNWRCESERRSQNDRLNQEYTDLSACSKNEGGIKMKTPNPTTPHHPPPHLSLTNPSSRTQCLRCQTWKYRNPILSMPLVWASSQFRHPLEAKTIYRTWNIKQYPRVNSLSITIWKPEENSYNSYHTWHLFAASHPFG